MIDVDKCVKDYTEKLTDLNEEQKQRFTEMATAMGIFRAWNRLRLHCRGVTASLRADFVFLFQPRHFCRTLWA